MADLPLGPQQPAMDPALAAVLQQLEIDWGAPGAGAAVPRPAGPPVGQQFAAPAYNPIADTMARMGVRSDGVWQNLAAFAPAVNRIEQAARAVPGVALEMSGIPSAQRAGEALAAGNVPQAVGQAAMALPSRIAAIPGMVLSEATAQAPDPRLRAIRDLQTEIGNRERTLQQYGSRNFHTRAAREAANKVELDGIAAARARIQAIEGEIDQERREAAAARRAEEAAATAQRQSEEAAERSRNTPTNRAYPGVGYGTTALGMGLASYLPFRATRGPALAYNRAMDDIATRWRSAIDRANDMSLTVNQRRHAASEAIGLRQQFNTARANVPEGPTGWDRLRTGAISGGIADAGIMAPDLFDYIYSMGDPEGALHSSSLHQLNPATNPGRMAAGFLGGAAFGGAGEELGARFPRVTTPTGFDAETDALLKRYKSLAPRGRRR